MSMERYYAGALSEAVIALAMPAMAAECQANSVFRCATDAAVTDVNAKAILAEAVRLERAAATLREVAAMGRLAPYLAAAE